MIHYGSTLDTVLQPEDAMTSNFTAAELRELALHVENELKQDIVDFDNCNACKAIPRALREYADRIDPKPDWAAQESKPVAWNFLGWARYDEGGFPHFCDIEDEGAFRVYAVNPAPSVSAQDASPKDGWKLVPVEMTAWMRKFSGINEWRWKAALDAAPKPEPSGERGEKVRSPR